MHLDFQHSVLRGLKSLVCLVQVAALLIPSQGFSYTPPKSNWAVLATAAAIVRLNLEVQAAARTNFQGPVNRARIQQATRQVAAALMLVAQEFKKKNMHGHDLPIVQSMLGGFVDQGAAAKFSQFFKQPDASLIPQVGPNFPKNVKPAVLDTSALPNGAGSAGLVAGAKPQSDQGSADGGSWYSPDVVALGSAGKKASGDGNRKSLIYDGSASKGGDLNKTVFKEGSGSAEKEGASESSESFEKELESDLGTVETSVLLPVPAVRRLPADEKDESVFESVGKTEVGKGLVPHKKTKKKSQKRSALEIVGDTLVATFWIPSAYAACPDGKECGKEGEGGGGGKDSGKAGEIMMALAMAMMAAAGPISAAIQANADKQIAQINAQTAITQAQIAAANSQMLAENQRMIAQQQVQATQQMAAQAQAAQTERLNMQLQQIERSRQDAIKQEEARRAMDNQLAWAKIQAIDQQRQDSVQLAQATLGAQLTQAGLSSGVVSRSQSSGLNVNRTGIAYPNTQVPTTATGLGGASLASTQPGLATNPATATNPTGTAGTSNMGLAFSRSQPASASRAFASQQLLTSALTPEQQQAQAELAKKQKLAKNKAKPVYRGFVRTGSAPSQFDPASGRIIAELSDTLAREVATGSSRGMYHRVPAEPSVAATTDLKAFRVEAGIASEPYWRGRQPTAVPVSSGHQGNSSSSSAGRGAYRAPSFSEETSGTSYLGH